MPDLEFYDGASTGQQIDDTVQKGIVKVDCGTITSLPYTKSSPYILAAHSLIYAVLGTPSAQQGDWTVTTANGSVTVSGAIGGSTSLVLFIGRTSAEV